MIHEHDRVVLTALLTDEGLEVGDIGTVVHVYPRHEAYEVEFVTLTGYLMPLPDSGAIAPPDAARPLRSLDRASLAARVGAPVASVQIIMTSDSAARADSVPRRLTAPVLGAGPHWSYALQWFGFALIALVGGAALTRRGIVADRASR